MLAKISAWIDKISAFLAARKGLLPLLGLLFILVNFIFQFFPATFYSQTDFFLHLGLLLAIIGFMLNWAL